jgi:hypothetical protein
MAFCFGSLGFGPELEREIEIERSRERERERERSRNNPYLEHLSLNIGEVKSSWHEHLLQYYILYSFFKIYIYIYIYIYLMTH